jgi:hypothetical protein
MKKKLSILLLFAISHAIFGQENENKISFVSYWSIGDSYDFKITKMEQEWKGVEQTKDNTNSYIANFKVIDSTENSYTIRWSYENDILNSYNIPSELSDKFSKYKITEIIYKTSEVGDIIEVVNWKEISDITNKMLDDLVTLVGKNDNTKIASIKLVVEPLKKIYSSKEGVEQIILKELQYFHFPMGVEFDTSEVLYYDDELPNILGGDPIKAKGKIYFEDIDLEESFCTLKQELSLDPSDSRELLKQVFKTMQLDDIEVKNALEKAVFKIEDKNSYEYFYYPGIPHKIEGIREVDMDFVDKKGKKINTTIIELIYNE